MRWVELCIKRTALGGAHRPRLPEVHRCHPVPGTGLRKVEKEAKNKIADLKRDRADELMEAVEPNPATHALLT